MPSTPALIAYLIVCIVFIALVHRNSRIERRRRRHDQIVAAHRCGSQHTEPIDAMIIRHRLGR